MANVKFPRKEFEKEAGKVDEKMREQISMFGTPLESISDNEIEIEIFPNRPDLLSMHGYLRSFLPFIGKKKNKTYKINSPLKDFEVTIDSNLKNIRPYTACAIVKGLKFNDEKIKEVIDIQEKIHATFGRNRKKIAIGVYPLEKIKLPIRFTAKDPDEIKFAPLEESKEMTGRQILSQTSTGREYAHLLADKEEYPIFIDANNEILSMPPIINSHKTGKITLKTKDIFIECSGFHKESLEKTLNIIVSMFLDMGGSVYSMKIVHKGDKKTYSNPKFSPESIKINIENANKTLGLDLKEAEMKKLLKKMGYEHKAGKVLVPAWRTDILHEVDIIEDIAIAYGYDKFIPEIPQVATIGEIDFQERTNEKLREILIGLGLQETISHDLTAKEAQFKKMCEKKAKEKILEVESAKTEYSILREDLMHKALDILSRNIDNEYPQKIFEIGKVFKEENEKIIERDKLCVSITPGNFTEIKQILDYLSKMLNIKLEISEAGHNALIEGRTASIFKDKKEIGAIGEVHPKILKNFKLKMPVALFEIEIERL